jgi:hypothetical protein
MPDSDPAIEDRQLLSACPVCEEVRVWQWPFLERGKVPRPRRR